MPGHYHLKEIEVKKPYSYISQPIPQDPISVYGSGGTMPSPISPKKKKKDNPTEMKFTSASPQKLKIRKKKGKRFLKSKGSISLNQQKGISGISIGGI